jgi:hypothetical protein
MTSSDDKSPQGGEANIDATSKQGLSSSCVPKWFVQPPKQRQRWGDTQILPHVNWGDLFFDLFYVSAAFNLSYVLKTDPSWMGLLYFIGCLYPILSFFWTDKMRYDSRFNADGDLIHRLVEFMDLAFLATAVLHIKPIYYMSNVEGHPTMFVFCLSNLLGSLISHLRLFEIAFIWVTGEKAAMRNCRTDIKMSLPPFFLILTATIYSGVKHYGNDNDYDRLLGEDSSKEINKDHIPIILCALLPIVWPASVIFMRFCVDTGDVTKNMVPMNIEFAIHRYGEWTMLLLGESILSLLVVDTSLESSDYYITFYAGIISVTMLQFLHYKSTPHRAEDHAFRKSLLSGILFIFFQSLYSASLLIVGSCYKMLLTEYTEEYTTDDYSEYDENDKKILRSLLLERQQQQSSLFQELERKLAGGGGEGLVYTLSTKQRQENIAIMFCAGLAAVTIFQDIKLLTHHNLQTSVKRCNDAADGRVHVGVLLLLMTRVAVVAFIATLWWWVTEPKNVALLGCATLLVQIILRMIGGMIFKRVPHHCDKDKPSHDDLDAPSHDDSSSFDIPPALLAQAPSARDLNFSIVY